MRPRLEGNEFWARLGSIELICFRELRVDLLERDKVFSGVAVLSMLHV